MSTESGTAKIVVWLLDRSDVAATAPWGIEWYRSENGKTGDRVGCLDYETAADASDALKGLMAALRMAYPGMEVVCEINDIQDGDDADDGGDESDGETILVEVTVSRLVRETATLRVRVPKSTDLSGLPGQVYDAEDDWSARCSWEADLDWGVEEGQHEEPSVIEAGTPEAEKEPDLVLDADGCPVKQEHRSEVRDEDASAVSE